MQVNVFACVFLTWLVFAGLCASVAVVGQLVSGAGRWCGGRAACPSAAEPGSAGNAVVPTSYRSTEHGR